MAAAVVDSIQNPAAQSAVVAAGFSGEYSIQLGSRSVLFTICAPAATRDGATATLNHVVGLMQQDLKAKQDQYKVPADQQVLIQMTSAPSLVSTRNGLQRIIVAVAGLGIVVTFVAAIVLDTILVRRSRRRRAADDEADELEPGDGTADDQWQPEEDDDDTPPVAWSDAPDEQTTSVVRPRRNT